MVVSKKGITFAPEKIKTVVLAQLVRASDCGSEGRGFEPHIPPQRGNLIKIRLRAYFFMSTLYELIQKASIKPSIFPSRVYKIERTYREEEILKFKYKS